MKRPSWNILVALLAILLLTSALSGAWKIYSQTERSI